MSNRTNKVSLFFTDEEKQKYEQLKQEYGVNNTELVTKLVEQGTKKEGCSFVDDKLDVIYQTWLADIDKKLDSCIDKIQNTVKKNECLEEWLSELQDEVDRYSQVIKDESTNPLSDEQIAAITGKREETVKEWRHGLRKPAGNRVREKLKPYCVIEGRWHRRQEGV